MVSVNCPQMNDDDFNWNNVPEYLVGAEPLGVRSLGQAAGYIVTGGMTVLGRCLSNAVDRVAHTPHILAVFLNMRVYTANQANKRSRHWWGRFYNKCSGEHAHYIKVKGLHLIQVL